MDRMIYPMKLRAPLKDYLWGGTRLKTEYGRKTSLAKVAESWELACHKEDQSVIENGADAGLTLEAYIAREGAHAALGSHGSRYPYFPLLIKLIDAHDDLSVQVHPDDSYAFEHEGEYGKMEMWYILDAEPDAEIIYGFAKEISREECRRRIEENTLLDVVRRVKVRAGDVIVIPAGTLHAIGRGIFLAEIQQNSDTTYRVYDYARRGADGKLRDLYIEVLGHDVDATNLGRVLGRRGEIVATGRLATPGVGGGRPARTYRFGSSGYRVTDPFAVLRPVNPVGPTE